MADRLVTIYFNLDAIGIEYAQSIVQHCTVT